MAPHDFQAKEEPTVSCLFCYKTVDEENREETKDELFASFYEIVCKEPPEGRRLFQNTGICGDCSHAIGKVCKISTDVQELQKKLVWHLEQLKGIMKTAERVAPRVKNFENSFSKYGRDELGEVIVTIKKERMARAKQCRQNIYEACKKQLKPGTPNGSTPDSSRSGNQENLASNGTQAGEESMADPGIPMIDLTVVAEENRNGNSARADGVVRHNQIDDTPKPGTSKASQAKITRRSIFNDSETEPSEITMIEKKLRPRKSDASTCNDQPRRSSPRKSKTVRDEKNDSPISSKKRGRPPKTKPETVKIEKGSPHNCLFCEFSSSSPCDLVNHETAFHWGSSVLSGKVRCPRCPFLLDGSTSMKHYFKAHLHIRHYFEAKCTSCGMLLSGKSQMIANSALRAHRIVCASVQDPFACQLCNRRFLMKGNLLRHMRSRHRGSKKTTPVSI